MSSSHRVVDVLVDGFGRLGPLSYYVPEGMEAPVGYAVQVPFGKRTATGLVIGPGNRSRARKHLDTVWGPRTGLGDLEAAQEVAEDQLASLPSVSARLAPTHHKGDTPLQVGPLRLAHRSAITYEVPADVGRVVLLRPPLVAAAQVAAVEAVRLGQTGQVLILCPTTLLVEQVLNQFQDGAVRLDAKAPRGAWPAFRDGKAPVGVGARGAVWYAGANLAGIILVEEQHEGHREPSTPRHHARVVAEARVRAHRASLTLISANPSPAGVGCVQQVVPVHAAREWPATRLHDSSRDADRSPDLPYRVRAEITAAAKTSTPLVVVSDSVSRRCTTCFADRSCRGCRNLKVGCVHEPQVPCPHCGQHGTRILGFDASRLDNVLGNKARPVKQADLPKFTNVGLVVIPDLDSRLSLPSLTPYARVADLIVDASTAAGQAGRVVGVTHGEGHPMLKLLLGRHDQFTAARMTYEHAKKLQLPPFGRLAFVRAKTKEPLDTSRWPGHVHGPVRADGFWEYLVRCHTNDLSVLRSCLDGLRKRRVKVQYHVD